MFSTTSQPRFWPWAIAFLLSRAGDMWSTGLFMLWPGGEQGEMNPLTSLLGLGYWPVLAINVSISAAFLYGHWHYCRYFGERNIPGVPSNKWDYQSLLFFGRIGQGWRMWFTMDRNSSIYYSQLAHVLVKAVSCVGCLAVMHNLGQVHGWALNDLIRNVLVRPSLVYYVLGIPLFLFAYVRMAERELRWLRMQQMEPDPI